MSVSSEIAEALEKQREALDRMVRENPCRFWHIEAPVDPLTGRKLWPCENPSQRLFSQSQAASRWFTGGNKSGKTEVVVRDTCDELNDSHPWRTTPREPLNIRHYALTMGKIREIILPKYYRSLPPGAINTQRGKEGYNREEKILYVRCKHDATWDHEVHMCTYEQDLITAEGGEYYRINWDEPPPQVLHRANKATQLKFGTNEAGALTPLALEVPWDISWIYHDIICKADGKRIAHWQVDTEENRHNLSDDFDEIFAGMTEAELDVRKRGNFAFLHGLVYQDPRFDPGVHVCHEFDGMPVRSMVQGKAAVLKRLESHGGEVWRGLDHGIGNPTAVSWWYFENGFGWKFMEYLASDLSVASNCEVILDMDQGLPGGPWPADPSIWNRDAATGQQLALEYVRGGVPIFPSNSDFPHGTAVVQRAMRTLPDAPHATMMFFACCTESIMAYQNYVWKPQTSRRSGDIRAKETPMERHKHLPDTDRYVWILEPSGVKHVPAPRPQADPVTATPRRIRVDLRSPHARQMSRLKRAEHSLSARMPQGDEALSAGA